MSPVECTCSQAIESGCSNDAKVGLNDGAEHMTDNRRDLDWLDEAYLKEQDRIAIALDAGDADGAAEIRAEAARLKLVDADGFGWRVRVLNPTGDPKPDYRFLFSYMRSVPDGPITPAPRGRFADDPLLSRSYTERLGSRGWLAKVVRHSEVLGYIAAATVAVGLWFLLGDLVGSLPGIVVLISMVLFAGALWVSTIGLSAIRYREAERLANLTRAAAVGVTGAIPWVATIETSSMTLAGRAAMSASVVAIASAVSFMRYRSRLTYFIGFAAWIAALGAIGIVISEAVVANPDEFASAQLGAMIAITVAFPLATRVGSLTWIPTATLSLAVVATLTIISTIDTTQDDLHVFNMVVLGLASAASAWWSRGLLRPALGAFHRYGAMAIAIAAIILVLTEAPWDFVADLIEWLGDIPLPVVLVTGGSAVLIAIGAAIRMAVGKVALREEGEQRTEDRGQMDG